MKVKFVRDNKNNVYNTDGLTKGFVYNVISVSHKDRHLLKIQNDDNYIRYYHKDLFIEVYEDIEHNILSYLSDENIDKIPKDSGDDYKNCIDSLESVYNIINKYKGMMTEPDLIIITDTFKSYPDITHELITNLLNTRSFIVGVNVTKETLVKYKGKKYQLSGKSPIMVLHENDTQLIGKRIYFKSLAL